MSFYNYMPKNRKSLFSNINQKATRLLLIFIAPFLLYAQQKPMHSQYVLNNFILNPAIAGIESYVDVKISYRNQWTGIDGAPTTTYFSIQGPIGGNKDIEKTNPSSFGKRGDNVRGYRMNLDYETSPAHHGIGFIAINDKTGYLNRYSVYANYAYHRPLSKNTTLSAGFLAGISSTTLDRTKIVWASLNPNDPAIGYNNNELSNTLPELGAGLWLYSKDYYLGASVLNILPGKAKFTSTDKYGVYYVPHIFLSAGYKGWINDDISIMPSLNIQFIQPTPMQVHANVKLQYQDFIWLGGGYRSGDQLSGFVAMTGINVSNSFNVGYSYDVTSNARLRTYAKNTHEILIGFLLNNKNGGLCPKNNW